MAALRTVYVDPGVVGGTGNGSSFANAYSSLNAAETAEDGDISVGTGSDEYVIFETRSTSSTADATGVTFSGWTTAADNYFLVRAHADHRANGIYGGIATSYRMEITDSDCIIIQEQYVRFNGLQVKQIYSSADNYVECFDFNLDAVSYWEVVKCYLWCVPGITEKYSGIFVVAGHATNVIFVRNCIVRDFSRRGIYTGNSTSDVYNCLVTGVSTSNAISDAATATHDLTVVNCISFNNLDDFEINQGSVNYCASDDGDGTNSVAPSGSDWDNELTDYANGDYRILSTGNLYQAGESQTNDSDVPSDDIAGNARVDGSESIGAFESSDVDVDVLPSTATTSLTLEAPTITFSSAITPTTLGSSLTLETPTVVIDCTVISSTLALATTLQTPTIDLVTSVTIIPTTLGSSLTLETPTIALSKMITPTSLGLGLTLEAPTIDLVVTATPATLGLGSTLETASVRYDKTLAPATLALGLTQLVSTISTGYVSPQTSELGLTLETPNIIVRWTSLSPAMERDLIDPYSGGAWLWLVEITIPGYDPIPIARNTEDVFYGASNFVKNNFTIGLATLSGGGSVPRIVLIVMQDAEHTLEDKINATQGACGGTVKIIRTHQDHLYEEIAELETIVRILVANSDTNNVIFQLGIPNPLLKKIPLRRYNSKVCPYANASLFKGPECQYAGGDPICGGRYEDCVDKSNEIHWGSELGLDPTAAKI